jgi:hypothetical protein
MNPLILVFLLIYLVLIGVALWLMGVFKNLDDIIGESDTEATQTDEELKLNRIANASTDRAILLYGSRIDNLEKRNSIFASKVEFAILQQKVANMEVHPDALQTATSHPIIVNLQDNLTHINGTHDVSTTDSTAQNNQKEPNPPTGTSSVAAQSIQPTVRDPSYDSNAILFLPAGFTLIILIAVMASLRPNGHPKDKDV